jgi:biopolymer transport protein ExbB
MLFVDTFNLKLNDFSMPIWMIAAEWMARIILLVLVGLSIWSISIIIDRRRFFLQFNFNFEYLKNSLTQNAQRSYPILDPLLNDFMSAQGNEKKEHAFASQWILLKKEMEKGLGVLGTLGSTTPFVGLFGTILGIIVAFGKLSLGQGDTNAVMFALAEALILTAVGLFVAIPAVVAFNTFNRKIKSINNDLESLKEYFFSK